MSDDVHGGRDELSRLLRELRSQADLSGTGAAKKAGFSQAKISRLENGVTVPTVDDVRTLARVYRVPRDTRRRMLNLAEDVREDHRRVVLHRGAADFQQRVGRIEAASAHIRTFTATIVPGLLQTPDYARAVFGSGNLSATEVDGAVAARLDRQQLLRQTGRRFTLVMTEGALRWCAHSPAIMAAQLDHIANSVGLPRVRIGIIPAHIPARVFPLHNWDLYDSRAVIVGTTTGTALLTNRQDVAAHEDLFTELEAMAVDGDRARDLLIRIATDYRLA